MRAASDRREEPGRFITDGGGTEILQRVRQVSVRFIPARAGNNIASPSPVITPAVYPRSAGNSRIASHNSFNKSVYPRSRGEQEVSWYLFTGACGLSPLARGTEPEPGDLAVKSRFIPARAGNRLKVTLCTKWHFFAFHILPTFLQQPILLKNGCPVDFEGVFSRRLWAVNIYRIVHPVR